MRSFLLLSFLGLPFLSRAQLTAYAGADTTWCLLAATTPAGPTLGKLPGAAGGTPPYTYAWSTTAGAASAAAVLDSVGSPRPTVVTDPSGADSLTFVLEVTDASGARATDTAVVYFSRWIFVAADCIHFKSPADTVSLFGNGFSNFPPQTWSWTPTSFLSDSTVSAPVCWAPLSTAYTATTTDRRGCTAKSTCDVFTTATRLPEALNEAEILRVYPLPATTESILQVPASAVGSTVDVYAATGRLVQRIPASSTAVRLMERGPLPAGLYFYRMHRSGLPVGSGHFPVR